MPDDDEFELASGSPNDIAPLEFDGGVDSQVDGQVDGQVDELICSGPPPTEVELEDDSHVVIQ